MYIAKLKQKPEFKDIQRANNDYNKYKNMQLHLLENLKKELELKQVKPRSIEMRNKLLQYRDKVNYQNEVERLTGYIESYNTRFPIGTIERLKKREQHLQKLIKEIN